METTLLGTLERALHEWAQDEIFSDGLPEGTYWPTHLTENMAKAAATVFDANTEGQVFLRSEEGGE